MYLPLIQDDLVFQSLGETDTSQAKWKIWPDTVHAAICWRLQFKNTISKIKQSTMVGPRYSVKTVFIVLCLIWTLTRQARLFLYGY